MSVDYGMKVNGGRSKGLVPGVGEPSSGSTSLTFFGEGVPLIQLIGGPLKHIFESGLTCPATGRPHHRADLHQPGRPAAGQPLAPDTEPNGRAGGTNVGAAGGPSRPSNARSALGSRRSW